MNGERKRTGCIQPINSDNTSIIEADNNLVLHHMVNMCQDQSLGNHTIFTHHAKSSKELVDELTKSLIEFGRYSVNNNTERIEYLYGILKELLESTEKVKARLMKESLVGQSEDKEAPVMIDQIYLKMLAEVCNFITNYELFMKYNHETVGNIIKELVDIASTNKDSYYSGGNIIKDAITKASNINFSHWEE